MQMQCVASANCHQQAIVSKCEWEMGEHVQHAAKKRSVLIQATSIPMKGEKDHPVANKRDMGSMEGRTVPHGADSRLHNLDNQHSEQSYNSRSVDSYPSKKTSKLLVHRQAGCIRNSISGRTSRSATDQPPSHPPAHKNSSPSHWKASPRTRDRAVQGTAPCATLPADDATPLPSCQAPAVPAAPSPLLLHPPNPALAHPWRHGLKLGPSAPAAPVSAKGTAAPPPSGWRRLGRRALLLLPALACLMSALWRRPEPRPAIALVLVSTDLRCAPESTPAHPCRRKRHPPPPPRPPEAGP
jgi:hypothetical protein